MIVCDICMPDLVNRLLLGPGTLYPFDGHIQSPNVYYMYIISPGKSYDVG